MNVLITGATGFLGEYVMTILRDHKAKIYSLGRREVVGVEQHLFFDLACQNVSLPDIIFEKVIHIAGKAHSIPKTEAEKQQFFDINVHGTERLLAALDSLSTPPSIIINISSVAVYGKTEGEFISEATRPKPNTPYGKSKLLAEEIIEKWSNQKRINYLSLRLPLVAGKNPPGNLGSMKRAIEKGLYPRIKGNRARKSVVNASDVANFIFQVNEGKGAYNLTDGIHPHFYEIETAVAERVGRKIAFSIPLSVLNRAAVLGDRLEKITKRTMPISSLKIRKITKDLTFDDTKARNDLGWISSSSIELIKKQL